MKEIGDWLRRERMERMVTLEAVRDETKISMRYLQALEEGEFGCLPGEPYIKGYIRLYARAVGCDPEPIVRRYQELQGIESLREETKGSPKEKRRTFLTKLSGALQWLGF